MIMDKTPVNSTKDKTPTKILEVRNLSFSYAEVPIFENISFDISKGDYFGIIGSNGSGKSTLIKLLLGFLTPQRGEIKINGFDVKDIGDWSIVGYLPQNVTSFNVSFPATVEEIVSMNINSKHGLFRRFKEEQKRRREKVYDVLKIVEMEKYANRLIGNLSGGQQQRVFIARMLVNNPKIIFLDEPTSGIDAKSEEAMYCLLARLNEELGITIIMVTHDIGAIKVHANKIGITGNKNVRIIDPEEITDEVLSDLYGYKINLNLRKHICVNCYNNSNNNMENGRGIK